MIDPISMTDRDIRRLSRKPLGTNGKSVRITEQEIDNYKDLIDSLLFCDCKRTYMLCKIEQALSKGFLK